VPSGRACLSEELKTWLRVFLGSAFDSKQLQGRFMFVDVCKQQQAWLVNHSRPARAPVGAAVKPMLVSALWYALTAVC
jgi:hypothetical protein